MRACVRACVRACMLAAAPFTLILRPVLQIMAGAIHPSDHLTTPAAPRHPLVTSGLDATSHGVARGLSTSVFDCDLLLAHGVLAGTMRGVGGAPWAILAHEVPIVHALVQAACAALGPAELVLYAFLLVSLAPFPRTVLLFTLFSLFVLVLYF